MHVRKGYKLCTKGVAVVRKGATALKMERRCTKEELYATKQSLRPFHAIPLVVSTVTKRDRVAAKVSLKDVVYTIIEIAKAAGQLQVPTDPIKVIVATDEAPLWKSSATRADVFVDVWGTRGCKQSSPMGDMVGHGWSRWHCLFTGNGLLWEVE